MRVSPRPPRRTPQNHRVQEQVQHSCRGRKVPSLCPVRGLAETPGEKDQPALSNMVPPVYPGETQETRGAPQNGPSHHLQQHPPLKRKGVGAGVSQVLFRNNGERLWWSGRLSPGLPRGRAAGDSLLSPDKR